MAGPEVKLELAGGLAEEGALGTDAVRVMEAIGRADSGHGLLLLMDLRSAVLGAVRGGLVAPGGGGAGTGGRGRGRGGGGRAGRGGPRRGGGPGGVRPGAGNPGPPRGGGGGPALGPPRPPGARVAKTKQAGPPL